MTRTAGPLTIASALVAAEIAAVFAPMPLRVPAGLLLVLVLPGLAATQAVRGRLTLERTEVIMLVPGLSLVTSVLVGLLVYAAHLRLTTVSWGLAIAVVVLGLLALGGRLGERTDVRPRVRLSGWIRSRAVPVAVILCSLAMIAGALVLAAYGERSATGGGFTELWALRTHTGPTPAVALGVTNHEHGSAHYRLQIVAGRAIKVLSFELARGRTLRRRLPIGNARDGVTLTLSKLPHHLDYRHVRLAPLEADGSQ